jgi:hypothetical protein
MTQYSNGSKHLEYREAWDEIMYCLQHYSDEGEKERKTKPSRIIFNRMRQCTACADDVLILGWSVIAIEEVVTDIKQAAVSNGLVINENKTKYININRNIKI